MTTKNINLDRIYRLPLMHICVAYIELTMVQVRVYLSQSQMLRDKQVRLEITKVSGGWAQ